MTEEPSDSASTPEPSPPPAEASGTAAPAVPAAPPHRHRVIIGLLFALATVIGVVAVLAVWANRQALNTDNWSNTSTQLLANKEIQTAVAAYAVSELFKSGLPQDEIKSVLPTKLQPLAGPAAAGLHQIAGQAAPKLLASSQVQVAWRQANHSAHVVLMKIINGGGSLATTNGGVVTLNLHNIITQLATALGVQSQVATVQAKLQSNRGTVQTVAKKAGTHIAAVQRLWTIATTLLYDIGVAMVVYGLVFVVAAWIAGHTRLATALRRALAPRCATVP